MSVFGALFGQGGRPTTRAYVQAVREWLETHTGVEAYAEPATGSNPASLLFVDAVGASIRRPRSTALVDVARQAGIPLYDVHRTGYPERWRAYNVAGAKRAQPRSHPASPLPLPDAVRVLEQAAGRSSAGESAADLRRLWRAARAATHPDRHAGDRTQWDRVEAAARQLGL